ncbi:beta-lactamase family protein [Maribacter sp.]|nr:beta-lactamase family protein [Maribacter sp.]
MPNTIKAQSIFFLFLLFASLLSCQDRSKAFTKELNEIAQQGYLPGFAVAVVNKDGILYQKGFGFADLTSKTIYTPKTIQSIASISKTTIGFSIMKLVEQGKLQLDTPINQILPYTLDNPNFQNDTIRVWHLATHTSGIADTSNNYDDRNRYFIPETVIDNDNMPEDWLVYFNSWKENKSLSLSDYCKKTLPQDGEWYHSDTFSDNRAGENYQYSNLGANLAAYVVEMVSGMSFIDFTKKYIFEPLSMDAVSWHLKDVDKTKLATSYVSEDLLATPFFGNSTYADGGLYSSCENLSTYLIEMIKGYSGKGQLLTTGSFKTMMGKHLPEGLTAQSNQKKISNSGIFWMHSSDGYIFHNGGNPLGGTIYMWFSPEKDTGRILMTNYLVEDKNSYLEFKAIWEALEEFAKTQ